MKIVEKLSRKLDAALLRRNMKRRMKAHGLPTNLKAMIAKYRTFSPEYADELERLLYPQT